MSTEFAKSSSRRRFLTGAAGAAGAAAALALGANPAGALPRGSRTAGTDRRIPPGRIGIQLYTVREMLAADPEGTIEMIAKAGFAEVEPAFTYGGRTAAQFAQILDANGLSAVASHHDPNDFRGELLAQTLDNAAALGQKYVGVSYSDGPQTADGYRAMAQEMNEWGRAAKARGLRWYAHLHAHEFETDPQTGEVLFDIWLAETDPRLVSFEMDLYWIQLADWVDPAWYLQNHESRFPLLHVKDGIPWEDGIETDLGEGRLDFPALFANLDHLAAHHYIAERDQQPDPVRTANVSYEYLRNVRIPRRRP